MNNNIQKIVALSLLTIGSIPLYAMFGREKSESQKIVIDQKPSEFQVQLNQHQMPHASQADFQALIAMVIAHEIEDLLKTTLQHPILGTNKDDFLAALKAYREVLAGIEKDPRIQALPTKTQLHAQAQGAPKRALTQSEKDNILMAVDVFKKPSIYTFYLNTHPDIEHDVVFFEQVKSTAQK